MKKILLLTFFVYSSTCFSQVDYKNILNKSLNEYDETDYVIQDTLLRENISEAFSYVIFSSSDLSTNTSAFGYSQNEEKTTITINSNFRIGNKLSPLYLRAGANASGSKSIFEFYSDDSWRNNVGFNGGIILRVFKPSVFFKGKSFNSVHKRREIYARKPIYNSEKYTDNTIKEIANLKNDLINFDGTINLLNKYDGILNLIPEIKKLIKEKQYDKAYEELEKEEKNISKFRKATKDTLALEKYVENTILYEFDKENDITYGYALHWLDFNINLGNSTYKFEEENIDADLLQEFQNSFEIGDDINKLKMVITGNYNYTRNAEKTIWFIQAGTSYKSGSFLENSLIGDAPEIFQNTDDVFALRDEDGRTLGLFNNIDRTMKIGGVNAYAAVFLTKNKNFGFNAAFNHEYLISKPDSTYFENNFSFLFGPIFRKVKEGKTDLTFGIDLGWVNGIYDTDITNNFTGRIRVGIPFNIYSKKKGGKEESK